MCLLGLGYRRVLTVRASRELRLYLPVVLTLLRSPFTLVTRVLKLVLGPVTLPLTLPKWLTPVMRLLNVTWMPLTMAPLLLSGGLRLSRLMAQLGASWVLLPAILLPFVTTPSSADPFTLPGFMMLTPVLGKKSSAMLLRTIPLLRSPCVLNTRQTNLVTRTFFGSGGLCDSRRVRCTCLCKLRVH